MRLTCWVWIGLAVVLAIAVPVPAQPGGQPPAQPQPAKRLADPLGRFTIEYPADWKVTSSVIDAGQSGTVLSGVSIRGYVDVSLGEFPNPLTAEGFGRDGNVRDNVPLIQRIILSFRPT